MQEAHEVPEDGVVVFWEALQDQATMGHTQAALHTCNGMRLLARGSTVPRVAWPCGSGQHPTIFARLLPPLGDRYRNCWEAGQGVTPQTGKG